MRFICANRISTFLRSRDDCWNASVLASARTRSRTSSLTSRVTLRMGAVVHFGFNEQAEHWHAGTMAAVLGLNNALENSKEAFARAEYLPDELRQLASGLPARRMSRRVCVACCRRCDGPVADVTRRVAVAPPYKGATSATVRRCDGRATFGIVMLSTQDYPALR
jgi:hypothetical protein